MTTFVVNPPFIAPSLSLSDFRIIVCLRKFELTVARISVCSVIEKMDGAWHTLSAILQYE